MLRNDTEKGTIIQIFNVKLSYRRGGVVSLAMLASFFNIIHCPSMR